MVHNPYTQNLGIYLELTSSEGTLKYLELYMELFSSQPLNLDEACINSRNFDLYRNIHVTQHFVEYICVWTRLALKYKNFEIYEKIIDEYTFYREIIKNYVQIIEMGSRFRKQCWMHELPMEIRKKIYYWIPKIFPKQLLKCREYSKRLFPF